MIFDAAEEADTKESVEAAKQDAQEILRVWRRRAFYSTSAFVLSCASVTPFLYGYPLHSYWESFGKYLVLLSMALLIPFGICTSIAISSWMHLRDLQKLDV